MHGLYETLVCDGYTGSYATVVRYILGLKVRVSVLVRAIFLLSLMQERPCNLIGAMRLWFLVVLRRFVLLTFVSVILVSFL